MHAFVVFSNKYLQPYGWSNTNFTATANYTNRKIEYDVKQLNYKPLEYKPTFYYFGNGGGIMLFVWQDIPTKLRGSEKVPIESFNVEPNLRGQKWLVNCS